MSTEENKAAERRILEEVFNKKDLAAVDELFTADYAYHGTQGADSRGREAFKRDITALFAAFPDFNGTLEDMVAEGDKVVSRTTYRGTHRGEFQGIPPTGRKVEFAGITLSRFEGGKNAEAWDLLDNLGMMQQLGVIPK